MKKYRVLGNIFVCFLLCGCTHNVMVPKEVLAQKGRVGLLWKSTSEGATFERMGGQGLLDMAVSHVLSGDLGDNLATVKVAPYAQSLYLQKFGPGFENKGFSANLVALPLNKEDLRESPHTDGPPAPYDFTKFKKDFDYVVYLDIFEFGAEQSFFGPVATGDPVGASQINIFLINTTTNTVAAEYHTRKTLPSKKKWDSTPDYKDLKEAIVASLQQTLEEAYIGFFDKKD